ncbi:MAG: ABC transporter substrate-binding protein [Hymenobacter sp.]
MRQALGYAINQARATGLRAQPRGAARHGGLRAGGPALLLGGQGARLHLPARARRGRCCAAAGYGPRHPLRLRLSTVAERKAVGEYLQKNWADVGVRVQIDINQSAAQQELVDNGRAAFFTKSWLGDYPDAENYLALFYSPQLQPRRPQ